MRPDRRPPSDGGSLRRTFPTKRKNIPTGRPTAGQSNGEWVPQRGSRGRGGRGKKKEDEAIGPKKELFLSSIFNKENIEDTEEMKKMVYRKCYLLLHGIARVEKGELKWNDEHKDNFFFSLVSLPYLEAAINPAHAKNELDSHMLAAYSFFKFLIATCGILDDRGFFINLILKARESEMSLIAVQMNDLLLSFSTAFGRVIAATGRESAHARSQQTFNEARSAVCLQLAKIYEGMGGMRIEYSNEKDLPSSLAQLYCEIEKNRMEKKGKKIVFESSDEEDEDRSLQSLAFCGATANDEVEEGQTTKELKHKLNEEETPTKKFKREVECEGEKAKKKKITVSTSSSQSGWNDEEDEEEIQYNQPSTSNSIASNANEFRSNLIYLAKESWNKSVTLFSIKKEPSVKQRFTMAGFIIKCLEEKYGDELLEILQYFTLQSFDPRSSLQEKEEVIGLLLYLDQRLFISESFFFLLLVVNDEETVRLALDKSEMCCRAQLEAATIGRKVLLGKPLQVELQTANSAAMSKRKTLENTMYHVFFPGIIEKNEMKELKNKKRENDREMAREVRLKTPFADEFWTTSSKSFNVDSEWSTQEVYESAVRVFEEMNKMFKGSLVGLIRTMSVRSTVSNDGFSDPRTSKALIALNRMKNSGFFDGSLLFALLRFDDANAMKKSLNKLSKLCDGFKKVVEAGSKSKGLKTDAQFLSIKDHFTKRAMKVNADCMQFFNALMSSEERKGRPSTNVEGVDESEKEALRVEKEPRKKKMKEMEEGEKEYSKNKKRKSDDVELAKKVKEEPIDEEGVQDVREEPMDVDAGKQIKTEPIEEEEEEEKKKKRKQVKREQTSDDEDCKIIEVEKKKIKVEVISDEEEDQEKKDKKRKRRDSKKSVDGDGMEQNERRLSAIESIKREVRDEREEETNSSSGWISMGIGEGNIDDDEEEEEPTIVDDESPDLIKVRKMLTEMADSWTNSWDKFNTRSSTMPTVDDRYKIAKMVIQFYENQFGEAFHNALFYKTRVQFTPSDLQEKEEVIGLVLFLDRMRLSIAYFFFFVLAMNDKSRADSILLSCKDTLGMHLKMCEIIHRIKQGEPAHKERNRMYNVISPLRKKLAEMKRTFFGELCEFTNSERPSHLVEKKVSKMKSTKHVDGNWIKYAKKFEVESDWSVYDVCESAILVFNQLNKLLRGSLISTLNEMFPTFPIDEASINDITTRTALPSVMHLNKMKIFPNGLIFLLMRTKNEKVMEEACSLLSDLTLIYLKFFRDFGADVSDSKMFRSKSKERSIELTSHEASQKCMDFLLNYVKQESSSGGPSPLTSLRPMEEVIPSPDESVWRYNSQWGVTTFWSQSDEWMEWEKKHTSDMERLSDRVDNFMKATAMREEHFEKKRKVFESLEMVLKDVLEKTGSTLFIVGSSPCAVGASNSNLDVFVQNSKAKTDLDVLVDILKLVDGYSLIPYKGKTGIRLTVRNDITGGVPMYVSIHVTPSTLHLSRVYQMVDQQDIRVSALSLVLKAWKILDLGCVSAKLQSYHVMSMLIHFLQCGVSPPIVPSLNRFGAHLDPVFFHQHDLPEPIHTENNQSMASLLIGFFTYFSHFEFEKYIISIREGRLLKRSTIAGESNRTMLIENPYDHCLKKPLMVSATTDVDFAHIRGACKRALDGLTTAFHIPSLPKL